MYLKEFTNNLANSVIELDDQVIGGFSRAELQINDTIIAQLLHAL